MKNIDVMVKAELLWRKFPRLERKIYVLFCVVMLSLVMPFMLAAFHEPATPIVVTRVQRKHVVPIATMIQATVTIRATRTKVLHGVPVQTQCTGSGFLFDNRGMIVTAKHVLDGAEAVCVIDHNGVEHKTVDWFSSDYTDVGIIYLNSPAPLPTVSLAPTTPDVGDTVYICGAPYGVFTNSLTCGIIANTDRRLGGRYNKRMYQTCSPAYPGNSGGPVYNKNGEVVGILVSLVDATLNFVVPADQIQVVCDLYLCDRLLRNM